MTIQAKHSANLLKSLEVKFKVLESLLAPLKFKDRKLRKNSQKIKHAVKEIAKVAGLFDMDGLEANGFWSFIRLMDKFAQLVVDSFGQNNHRDYDPKLDVLSSCFVKYLGVVDVIKKSIISDDNMNVPGPKLSLTSPTYDTTLACFRHFMDMEQEQSMLHGYFTGFFLCKSARKAILGTSLITAIFSKLPMSIMSVWNPMCRGKYLMECQTSATRSYPFAVWNITDLSLIKTLLRFIRRKQDSGLKVRTVLAKRQQTYYLPGDGSRVVSHRLHSKNTGLIRCRLIKDRNRPNVDNVLILHCHGGGLMAQSPDSHEGYLKDWAHKLCGVPILSVDYSLGKAYPVAHQEVLDVYLWLVSGDQSVKRQLGFQPTKIILVGDSAGGSLCLSLILMLHDVKDLMAFEMNEIEHVLLTPSAFVSIYSGFRSITTSPSKMLMAMLDPVLSPGVFLASTGALVASTDQSEERSDMVSIFSLIDYPSLEMPILKKLAQYLGKIYKDLKILGSLVRGLDKKPWFRQSNYYVKEKMKKMDNLFSVSPYLNSMDNYGHNLNSLKDTSLHLITTHYDPSLDDNITLAKLWPGPTTIEVLDELPHGFLNFTSLSKEAQIAADLCAKKLKLSCLFAK